MDAKEITIGQLIVRIEAVRMLLECQEAVYSVQPEVLRFLGDELHRIAHILEEQQKVKK